MEEIGPEALYYACNISDKVVAKKITDLLLKENADPNKKVTKGKYKDKLPADKCFALWKDDPGVLKILESVKLVTQLLADIYWNKETHALKLIQALVLQKGPMDAKEYQAVLNTPNKYKYTPLGLAIYYGRNSIVEALLKAGADAEYVDGNGNTPLHIAAHNTPMIEYFLSEEAEDALFSKITTPKIINNKDKSNRTALYWSFKNKLINTAMKLLKKPGIEITDDVALLSTSRLPDMEKANIEVQRLLKEKTKAKPKANAISSAAPAPSIVTPSGPNIAQSISSAAPIEGNETPSSISSSTASIEGNEITSNLASSAPPLIEGSPPSAPASWPDELKDIYKNTDHILSESETESIFEFLNKLPKTMTYTEQLELDIYTRMEQLIDNITQSKDAIIDEKGNSPFHIIARKLISVTKNGKDFTNTNAHFIEMLIDRGFNINLKNDEGKTPLQVACDNGNESIALELIKAGARMEDETYCTNPAVTTAYMVAIKSATASNFQGPTEDVLFVNPGNGLPSGRKVYSNEMRAAQSNSNTENEKYVSRKSLIEEAEKKQKRKEKNAAAQLARVASSKAKRNALQATLNELIRKDAKEAKSEEKQKLQNQIRAIQRKMALNSYTQLGKKGATPQTRLGKKGATPQTRLGKLIKQAASETDPEIKAELQEKIDALRKEILKSDFTVGQTTAMNPLFAAILDRKEQLAINMITKDKTNINTVDAEGKTPLMMALQKEQFSLANTLIELDANTRAKDGDGMSVFVYACESGNSEIARAILADFSEEEKKASLDDPDAEGKTPLMITLQRLQFSSANTLIELGANTKAKDEDGISVLAYACESGNREIARAILATFLDEEEKIAILADPAVKAACVRIDWSKPKEVEVVSTTAPKFEALDPEAAKRASNERLAIAKARKIQEEKEKREQIALAIENIEKESPPSITDAEAKIQGNTLLVSIRGIKGTLTKEQITEMIQLIHNGADLSTKDRGFINDSLLMKTIKANVFEVAEYMIKKISTMKEEARKAILNYKPTTDTPLTLLYKNLQKDTEGSHTPDFKSLAASMIAAGADSTVKIGASTVKKLINDNLVSKGVNALTGGRRKTRHRKIRNHKTPRRSKFKTQKRR
jgi:ankyrin repeat protein/DNA-directed RNA polymerase subunit F